MAEIFHVRRYFITLYFLLFFFFFSFVSLFSFFFAENQKEVRKVIENSWKRKRSINSYILGRVTCIRVDVEKEKNKDACTIAKRSSWLLFLFDSDKDVVISAKLRTRQKIHFPRCCLEREKVRKKRRKKKINPFEKRERRSPTRRRDARQGSPRYFFFRFVDRQLGERSRTAIVNQRCRTGIELFFDKTPDFSSRENDGVRESAVFCRKYRALSFLAKKTYVTNYTSTLRVRVLERTVGTYVCILVIRERERRLRFISTTRATCRIETEAVEHLARIDVIGERKGMPGISSFLG